MSWILGGIGGGGFAALRDRIRALHPEPLRRWEDAEGYLAVGGLGETCRFGALPGGGAWAVVGLGIRRHEEHCAFLDADAWGARLAMPIPAFDGLDGHFAAVRVSPGRAEVFTDVLGVRTLYLTRLSDGVAFSTRLDWLARLRGGAEIDFEAFGTHWLAFNQLSTDCLVRGIRRLGPRARATCTARGFEASEHPWTPAISEEDHDGAAFAQTLTALAHAQPNDGRALSLSLSGGMDSRLLLAMRLGAGPARTHTFGPSELPDAHVARRIAEGEGLLHLSLHAPVPDADACLALLRSHVAQTQAVSTASAVLGLRYYPTLHARRFVMIDGGMGEVARRKFLNRLLLRDRAALYHGDGAALLPYLRFPRADLFNAEATAAMERGARRQIEALWRAMPIPQTLGVENFLDVLRVRTVLPNFYGFEQNRLDGVIQNYMPFAQPSLLRAVFRVPVSLRRGGRLVRRLIRSRRASLTRYPLVKSGVTHPFGLPPLAAYLWSAAKRRLGRGYTDRTRLRFLETVQAFVLDAVHAQDVQTYPAYDAARLVRLVEDFYAGNEALAAKVDWWLAFEMWRRALRAP